MTEEELTLYRLQIRVAVRDVMLNLLVEQASTRPLWRHMLQGTAVLIRQQMGGMTFANLHPAQSDQTAGEAQEAIREMLDALKL